VRKIERAERAGITLHGIRVTKNLCRKKSKNPCN